MIDFTLDIQKIYPELKVCDVTTLKKRKNFWNFLSKTRIFNVTSQYVALVTSEFNSAIYAPLGTTSINIEVNESDNIIMLPRTFELYVNVKEFKFAEGVEGETRLLIPLRILAHQDEMPHPFTKINEEIFSKSNFEKSVGHLVSLALGKELRKSFIKQGYDPSKGIDQIQDGLTRLTLNPEIKRKLRIQAGVAFNGSIRPLYLKASEKDEVFNALEFEEKEKFISGLENKRKSLELNNIREELQKHKSVFINGNEIEQFASMFQNEIISQQNILVSELDKLEKEKVLVSDLRIFKNLEERTEHLLKTIAALKCKFVLSNNRSLTVNANWQVHDKDGSIIVPKLGIKSKLPSGAYVDVKVQVSRDAYTYIFIKGSDGNWQLLVPEPYNNEMMGIKRQNFQYANETIIWPGANKSRPDLPYWCIDPQKPGTDSVIVAASIKPLDIQTILQEDHLGLLREMAPNIGVRGIFSPFPKSKPKSSNDQKEPAEKTCKVITCFSGEDVCYQETIITHSLLIS